MEKRKFRKRWVAMMLIVFVNVVVSSILIYLLAIRHVEVKEIIEMLGIPVYSITLTGLFSYLGIGKYSNMRWGGGTLPGESVSHEVKSKKQMNGYAHIDLKRDLKIKGVPAKVEQHIKEWYYE